MNLKLETRFPDPSSPFSPTDLTLLCPVLSPLLKIQSPPSLYKTLSKDPGAQYSVKTFESLVDFIGR